MSIYKDKVIVLRRHRFGESDLIVRSLNHQGALLSFFAKGAVKSNKRFAGGLLEPGHFIGVEYKKSRTSSLHSLRQAHFLKRFEGIRTDYDRLNMALHFLRLMEHISQEGVEDSTGLFNLLGNALCALESSNNLSALCFIFEFRLLLNQGVLPVEAQADPRLFNITVAEHEKLCQSDFSALSAQVHEAVERYVLER